MALADTAKLIAQLILEDKFSATAKKYDSAIAGMDKRTRALDKIGTQIGSGARNAINNIGKIAVVGGGLLASQVALGVKSLGQLEEVKNQTDAVIKSTEGAARVSAEAIRSQAEALEDLSTVDDKVIQAGQNMLLTFKNVRNEVGEGNDIFTQATETLLDLSVAMGTEPKQAAIQLGKALNDPIKGITALTRVGVTFTQQQKDQIVALVEAGKTMEAQKIILRELNSEFGGSAKAFGQGPAADMRRFGDAVEGAQQALATGFLPLMTKVSERVQEALGNPEVLANITRFGESAAAGVDQLIDIGTKLPWDAIGQSAKVMGQGAKALLDAFTGLPPWIQTAVLTGWGLNKLTGGALGSLAGTLAKGFLPGGAFRGATPATPLFTKEVGIPGTGGGGGAPVVGGLGAKGLLAALGGLGALVGAGLLIAEGVKALDPDAQARKQQFGNEKTINQSPFTKTGGTTAVAVTNQPKVFDERSFNLAAANTRKVEGQTEIFNGIGRSIKDLEQSQRQALKEGDINAARHAERTIDQLHELRGTVDRNTHGIIPSLGRVHIALSTANRNFEEGNQRQREIADRIREAREAIGTGNLKLGVIAEKDFSPTVNVDTHVNTSVSISDVQRQLAITHVATDFHGGFIE